MRTSIDIPDELYRVLKVRAALSGTTVREVILGLIEQGLQQQAPPGRSFPPRRSPPPVIIPPSGKPVPAVSPARLRRWEEEEDEARHAGSP